LFGKVSREYYAAKAVAKLPHSKAPASEGGRYKGES